jgi:hypothetical protein
VAGSVIRGVTGGGALGGAALRGGGPGAGMRGVVGTGLRGGEERTGVARSLAALSSPLLSAPVSLPLTFRAQRPAHTHRRRAQAPLPPCPPATPGRKATPCPTGTAGAGRGGAGWGAWREQKEKNTKETVWPTPRPLSALCPPMWRGPPPGARRLVRLPYQLDTTINAAGPWVRVDQVPVPPAGRRRSVCRLGQKKGGRATPRRMRGERGARLCRAPVPAPPPPGACPAALAHEMRRPALTHQYP